MIYIETDKDNKVTFIHYQTTSEMDTSEGYLIDFEPKPEIKEGFTVKTYFDGEEFSYEYMPQEETLIQRLKLEVEMLNKTVEDLINLMMEV